MQRRPKGFTLMELMVVVVIIGVLAVVAMFSYKKIQQSARKSDAISLLGEIKTKQEVFFDTYSTYESSTTDESKFDGTKLYDKYFTSCKALNKLIYKCLYSNEILPYNTRSQVE